MRPQTLGAGRQGHRDVPLAPAPLAPANDAMPFDIPGLLAHIVERYHRTHLRDLASAIALADQVEQDYAGEPACPHGLGLRLRRLAMDLEAHQRREEFSLFPLLRIGTPHCLDFVTRRMMDDHLEMELQLASLQTFNVGHRPSFDVPVCWQALSCLCRKLEADLREHARLEHEVLYAALLRQGGA